jgi:hypothetical protein
VKSRVPLLPSWRRLAPPAWSAAALLLLAPLVAQTPRVTAPSPARHYTLSLFSDQGYHSLHVRGASADVRNPNRIGLTDLTLSVYAGDASRRVETVILSPQAVLQPESQIVSGPNTVRLLRDDLEVTGEDWVYDHGGKRILIQRNARIVFEAAITDLLK